MNTYETAKRYVEKLKWSVIPVKNKIPQIPSWSLYGTRLPTTQELRKWFQESQNDIAIVTGKLSDLSVLDVDSKELPEQIQKTHSAITVQTPRGLHLYFRHSEGLKNHVNLFPKVDVRSEGGFVVAPSSPGYYFRNPWFRIDQLRPFPLDIIPKEENTSGKISKNSVGWIAEALNGLQNGNRDNTFTKVIGRLHFDGYSSDDILVLLTPYAESSQFGIEALKKKVEHIKNDYPNSKSNSVTVLNPDNDTDSLNDFLRDIKPIEWIVSPIIGRGTICFIAGLPETMKTWICADLAIECARGGEWLGKYKTNKCKVLFIDQERWKGEVQRRFKALMNEKDLVIADLEENLILKSQTTTRLDLDDSFNAFRKRLYDIKPGLVIVDSWATFHTKNENSRQEIQGIFDRINSLRYEFNCTFVFLDHEGKSILNKENQPEIPNAFAMTGSVGKPAAIETAFSVRRLSENKVILYHTKSTLGAKIEPLELTIQDTTKGISIK